MFDYIVKLIIYIVPRYYIFYLWCSHTFFICFNLKKTSCKQCNPISCSLTRSFSVKITLTLGGIIRTYWGRESQSVPLLWKKRQMLYQSRASVNYITNVSTCVRNNDMWMHTLFFFQVVYVTATLPYILMIILLVRGLTLPGAMNGIRYYIYPNFTRIGDPKVMQ